MRDVCVCVCVCVCERQKREKRECARACVYMRVFIPLGLLGFNILQVGEAWRGDFYTLR
jgi:hypothetical protein